MTMTDTNKECTKPTNRLFYHMRNNFPYVPALLTTMPYLYFIDLFLIFLLCCCSIYGVQLREDERRIMYNTRGYEWPLPGVIPNTPGWNRLMRRRMAQVQQLPDIRDRYTGWVGVITQAIVAPNFTENGFRVAKAPSHVVDLLKKSITNNIHNATKEYLYDHIDGNSPRWDSPLVMHDQAVSQLVIEKLQPLLEEWVGIKLIGKIAYGPRIYRNESILHMHVDKFQTHIISCILHIDHDKESEPWPLFIEDFLGNTNEVILESGDMLFYESSKCIHGRPRPFNGKSYSSIFVHYYPAEDWDVDSREHEVHYAIPSIWTDQDPDDPNLDRLVMRGTSFTEPDCPDEWCGSVDTIKWNGSEKEKAVKSYVGLEELDLRMEGTVNEL